MTDVEALEGSVARRGRGAPGRVYWWVTAFAVPPILGSAFFTRGFDEHSVVIAWPTPVLAVTLAAAIAAVIMRGWYPVIALVVVVAGSSWARIDDLSTAGFDIATVLALHAVAMTLSRRATFVVGAAVFVVVVSPALIARDSAITDGTVWQPLLVVGLALAVTDAARARRAEWQALADRAERAELSREIEAKRQVAEERLRIARDLHDAVAHQIAVINLHASAARDSLAERPEAAAKSLDVIGTAAREVLHEISDLLGMLRSHDEGDTPGEAPAEAPIGLDGIGDLIDAMQGHGVDIALEVRGKRAQLEPSVDVVAYRVVKEALTNAFKHGDSSTVHLVVTWLARSLVIDCRNDIAASGATRVVSGHGLTGMAELVSSVGGDLTARPHDTQFRLLATLPVAASATPVVTSPLSGVTP